MTNSKLGIIVWFMIFILAVCASFALASNASGEVLFSSSKAGTTIKADLKLSVEKNHSGQGQYITTSLPTAFTSAQGKAFATQIKPFSKNCLCHDNKPKHCSFGFALDTTGGSYLAAYAENCELLPPKQSLLPGRLAEVALPPPKERS